jgi:hypothetical protein
MWIWLVTASSFGGGAAISSIRADTFCKFSHIIRGHWGVGFWCQNTPAMLKQGRETGFWSAAFCARDRMSRDNGDRAERGSAFADRLFGRTDVGNDRIGGKVA